MGWASPPCGSAHVEQRRPSWRSAEGTWSDPPTQKEKKQHANPALYPVRSGAHADHRAAKTTTRRRQSARASSAAPYVTFRLRFHRFGRFELDLRGHTCVRGAAFSCPRFKLADMLILTFLRPIFGLSGQRRTQLRLEPVQGLRHHLRRFLTFSSLFPSRITPPMRRARCSHWCSCGWNAD